VTGLVNQRLLLRCEYLIAENRILRSHLPGTVRLADSERRTLADIGKRLGRKLLSKVACVAKPETILGWCRRLIIRIAWENRGGDDRVAGALPISAITSLIKLSEMCLGVTAFRPHQTQPNHLGVWLRCWTLFGPYVSYRWGPHWNGPRRQINDLGQRGMPTAARNQIQVLVLAREWRFKSSHPHQ
jgi:hypothetical protein